MSGELLRLDESVELATRRCYECGRWWAYERFAMETPECPVCSGRSLKRYAARINVLERGNASLRGALTKAKGRSRKSREVR
jgi:hypothetical protein